MGKNVMSDNKLTPSAKEALNETMHELHELLLSKASYIAQEGQPVDKEVSLRDIIEARDSLFRAKLDKDTAEFKRQRIITLITSTGVIYSIIGIFIYIIQNKNVVFEKSIGLIIICAGLLIILFGIIYPKLISRKFVVKHNNNDSIYNSSDNGSEIIQQWQIIEKLGSNLMRQRGFSYNESRSINDILKFLSEELKSEKLKKEMRDLLSVRNRIIHEGLELGRNEKQLYMENADKIIERLEGLEK